MLRKLQTATDTLRELWVYYAVLLLVSATIFSFVEGKSFVTAVYWAGITSLGIGYGDVTPATDAGKFLAVFTGVISLLFILPLLIGRTIVTLMHDEHQFTDEEQKYILETCKMIRDKETFS
jgi:voltage-gated potassium channel